MPALNIPVRVNLDELKAGLKETTSLAGGATKQIAKQFIDANAAVLKTAGGIGTAVGAARTLLGILGPLAVGITAIKGVFELMGDATDLAKQKIEDFYNTAERAGKAGVSTDFFQRMTKSGETLKLTIEDMTAALDRFASKAQARLGGSDLDNRITELVGAGNFAGNAGVSAVSNALGNEAKLRATVDLITEALAKGERLAALDLAEKVFGSTIADNLRANSNYLREMLVTADKLAASKIVSDEEIGRAIDLKNRLEDAQKVLAERFKPIQDDLAKLGMNYESSWVNIYENLASAVGVANQLYAALKEIPDIFARAGSASFWTKLTEATGKLGLNSDPASLGLEPITSTSAGSPANAKLGALLSNPAAVRRAMQEAIDAETKVLGDRSKAPASTASTNAQRDPFETAIDQGNRRIAIITAETATIGQNSEARERARIVAQLEEAAKRANAAAGKELYATTEASNPAIREQADRMLAAAKAAREQQTAFQGVQDSLRYAGNQLVDVLDRLGERGTSFGQIMSDVFKRMSREMLLAAITGEGAFGRLFGVAGSSGGVGGIMGAIGSAFTGTGSAARTVMVGSYAMPMFAAGTDNAPGGLAVVGEKGREIVNLPKGSQVVPNEITERLLRGVPAFASSPAMGGGFAGAVMTTISPSFNVTVQGQPGMSAQGHAELGERVAKAAELSIRKLIASELRMQRRPGGMLR